MSDAGSVGARRPRKPSRRSAWIAAALILFVLANLIAFTQAPHPRLEGRGVAGWFLYPIERNPADRLARVGRQLKDVAISADGQRAVAVGEDGVILISSNSGESWTAQTSGTAITLYGVSISGNGKRAVAVGDDSTILISVDSGISWEQKMRGTRVLSGVSISEDGMHVIAVGTMGEILTSLDGGISWKVRKGGGTRKLSDISLSGNGKRAVAVGDDGTILTSRDGGINWGQQVSRTNSSISSVSLSGDGQRAIAVGDDGTILVSGADLFSWTAQTSGTKKHLLAVSLSVDGQRAVAVGEGGVIMTSRDGGLSWAARSRSTTDGLFAVSVSGDGKYAIAISAFGSVITSSDDGLEWTARTADSREQIQSIAMSKNGTQVIAVGTNGLMVTNNIGRNYWIRSRSTATNEHLTSISLSGDGLYAVAVGEGGVIQRSSDGGQSWSRQLSSKNVWDQTSTSLTDLRGVSVSGTGQQAVAVGLKGTILTSGNGGQSWSKQESKATVDFASVSLSEDGQRAVAVGSNGVIVGSNTGGQRWANQFSGTNQPLNSVGLSADGQRAVAVGDGGVIVTTSDGGQRWANRFSGTFQSLNSVALSVDGERAIVVGDGGVILTTNDGGQSWKRIASGSKYALLGVSLSADGMIAIAIGFTGVRIDGLVYPVVGSTYILISPNGGESWVRRSYQRATDYARYPAPWYYVAFFLCAAFLTRAFSGTARSQHSGAAVMAASDAPTVSLDQDRLDFGPLARGISRFLRNANTEPPLTLAITGEWGSGKSSLMGQVCADLRANRWRPIWFNAWHHQNEEQLLAALLVAVRESGVPPILSPAGVGFRLRLLLIRAQQRVFATLFVVTLASLIIAFVASHPDAAEWQGVTAMLSAFKTKDGQVDLSALQSILPILATIGIFVAIGRTIKAFGVDPAVLLSSTMAKFRLKDASAQTSFRMRFAEQFGEVTQALAHPMVIVIDDLDRCKPETVLNVMEAVNFLTSSGKCFVIFGMATQRVQAALALSFKEIAGELVQFDGAGDERQRRRDYARDYLEKLINIEILVPDRTDLPPSRLLEEREPAVLDWLSRLIAEVKRWWLLVPVGGAIAAGVWFASFIALPEAPKSPVAPVDQVAKSAPQAPAAPAVRTQAQRPTAPAAPVNQAPVIIPGNDRDISPLWFLLAFAALLLIGAALLLRWYQRQKLIVQDTQAFRDATRIWTPIATFTRNSPRSIKRFGNRIRYLAMLQQGEQFDEPPMARRLWEQVSSWFTRLSATFRFYWANREFIKRILPESMTTRQVWEKIERAIANFLLRFKQRPRNNVSNAPILSDYAEPALALSEHRVVALGALHSHFGDEWRMKVENEVEIDWVDELSTDPKGFGYLFQQAIEAYRSIPGASWPPSGNELDAFERSLKGVRLPGDGLTFDEVASLQMEYGSNSAKRKRSPTRQEEQSRFLREAEEARLESVRRHQPNKQ